MPEDWRKANITCIFKKGNKQDPGNYRPVSLTSVICKLLESNIREAIMDHLSSYKLLSDSQYGFEGIEALYYSYQQLWKTGPKH